ncbi:MAG: hypothetical protein IPO27_03265 [Bacteroidetes bacterium]|nr:hypothetical protein [Bacteroidota bacterium]
MKQQITHAQGFNFEIKTNNGFNCTGNAIATLPNNEYIVCGSSIVDGYKDIYVCKVNNAGDTLFTRSIGGSADDEGYCIKPTVDSGYIIAGYTKSFGSGNADFFLVKLLANGTIDWTRTSGGTLADGSYSVMQTTDNGYLVVGFKQCRCRW